MRLRKLSLNDFKCFKDIEIEFGRITILTGANSSGKSSLLQSILAPLQSSDFPFSLSTNGKFVNLGDFVDIAYMHEERKIIHMDYVFNDNTLDVNIKTAWKINAQNRLPLLHSLSAQTVYYYLEIKAVEEKYLLSFKYYPDKEPEKESAHNRYEFAQRINQLLDDLLSKIEKVKEGEMESLSKKLEEKFKRNEEPIEIISNSIDDLRKQAYEKGSFVLEQALGDIVKIFSAFENDFNFISSFRFNPEKMRFEISKADLKVGRHGENYEDQIVQWELKKSKEFEKLASIMKELKLFEEVQVKRVEGGNYHLLLKIHKNGAFSSITDVGFGISQFLPIIISDIQLGESSTLAMSQPEIHLHPSVQSEFGNYINNKINNTKKNYIIETHSEYLLNKLRLLITKGDLKKDDLRVHYISNKGDTVEHYKIEFTENGQILNAPEEFFETYMTDVMDIALNA